MPTTNMTQDSSPVLPHALDLPIFRYLKDKRVVLASASPRRKELMELVGLKPEIVPSRFAEDFPHMDYANALAEYPVATATEKALEVFNRSSALDEDAKPDLLISADTVVIYPPQSPASIAEGVVSKILEKPLDKVDQMRNLTEMNGKTCEVVTGVIVVYPSNSSPGFKLHSMAVSTLIQFSDNSPEMIKAYVGNGYWSVSCVEGDFHNVAGWPTAAFLRWMENLHQEGAFDE